MTGGKWRVTASRTVVKDRWIDLRADTCVTPGGHVLDPFYVLAYPDWVHVLALTGDDRIVMVRQYRHAAGEHVLELPGGAMDPADADPSQAAARELAEETAYTAASFGHICSQWPNPATHANKVHFYRAIDPAAAGTQKLDAGEDGLTVRLVPVEEVLRGLRGDWTMQSMHVSAILLGLADCGRISF